VPAEFGVKALALLLALSPTPSAQTPTPLLQPPTSANAILPFPRPAANLADWNAAAGRKLASLTVDKVTLRGFDYPGPTVNAPTVLVFGGNGWTIDDADPLLRAMAQLGARVVAYDYRGYGFSEGRADVRTFRRDALRLYDALAAQAGSTHVAVYGFSMGTAIASYVASERSVAGLIVVAPMSSAVEFFRAFGPTHLRDFNVDKLMTTPDADEAYDEAGMVAKSTAPLLVVHGDADDVIPYAEGKEVYEASRSTHKKFVTLHRVDHNDAPGRRETLEALETFFTSLR
jgi:pimeloyl-ACP methyl ester carboxylesterase